MTVTILKSMGAFLEFPVCSSWLAFLHLQEWGGHVALGFLSTLGGSEVSLTPQPGAAI